MSVIKNTLISAHIPNNSGSRLRVVLLETLRLYYPVKGKHLHFDGTQSDLTQPMWVWGIHYLVVL